MDTIDTIISRIVQHIHGSSCIPGDREAALRDSRLERAQTLEAPSMSCFVGRASLGTR